MKKFYRRSVIVLFVLLSSASVYSQSDNDTVNISRNIADTAGHKVSVHLYRMNYWVSTTICIAASAADVYAIPNVIKGKKDLTDDEIRGLNRDILTGFDAWALHQDLSQRDIYMKWSDYTLPVIISSAGFLMLDKSIKKDWLRILMMYWETHSFTFSIYNYSVFGPAFQNKYRPVVYYPQPYDQIRGGNMRNSMYSGHTATALASTFFIVKVYSDYHPEIGNKKYLLYGLATIPPLIEGYLRVKGLEHFPSDVAIGMGIGALCGILVPEIHRMKNQRIEVKVSGSPFGTTDIGVVYKLY